MVCVVEDETRGADAILLRGAAFDARGVQEEAETDNRGPVKKDWEASAGRYIITHRSRNFLAPLSVEYNFSSLHDHQYGLQTRWAHIHHAHAPASVILSATSIRH